MATRRVQFDYRTNSMSTEALTCRTWGHAMVPLPTPADQRLEYRRRGQRITRLQCTRGCGYWREVVRDRYTGEPVTSGRSGYADGGKDYLVQEHGTGRLPKAAAYVAFCRVAGDD